MFLVLVTIIAFVNARKLQKLSKGVSEGTLLKVYYFPDSENKQETYLKNKEQIESNESTINLRIKSMKESMDLHIRSLKT